MRENIARSKDPVPLQFPRVYLWYENSMKKSIFVSYSCPSIYAVCRAMSARVKNNSKAIAACIMYDQYIDKLIENTSGVTMKGYKAMKFWELIVSFSH
jgi:hypothetical protein